MRRSCSGPRVSPPGFHQGAPSICIPLSAPFHPQIPCPCSTPPGARTYLAATPQGAFLAVFIFISSRLRLFLRCAQRLVLNPFAPPPQKKRSPMRPYPGDPGLHLRGFAFPGINSVHWFCRRISIEELKVRRFFCLLGLGCKGWGPLPRGAPLSLNPRGLSLF